MTAPLGAREMAVDEEWVRQEVARLLDSTAALRWELLRKYDIVYHQPAHRLCAQRSAGGRQSK